MLEAGCGGRGLSGGRGAMFVLDSVRERSSLWGQEVGFWKSVDKMSRCEIWLSFIIIIIIIITASHLQQPFPALVTLLLFSFFQKGLIFLFSFKHHWYSVFVCVVCLS